MAVVNARTKEINAKIVYYGPGHSGKTTNLKKIYSLLKPDVRGKLMALSTQSDRTIFFDYLPMDLGSVRGMKMKIQLYTVPGQVFYNSTRRLVLKNVDGVVFVADSSRSHLTDNIESLTNLQENLSFLGNDIDQVPWVIQYNKRDAEDAMTVAELSGKLNRWQAPEVEAIAESGKGVMATLTAITKLVVRNLSQTAEEIEAKNKENSQLGSTTSRVPKLDLPEDKKPGAKPTTPVAASAPKPAPPPAPAEPEIIEPAEPVKAVPPTAVEEPSVFSLEDEPPTPSPDEIDAMMGDDLEEIELDLNKDVIDDAEIELDDADIVEDIEPVEEIELSVSKDIRWEQGVLVIPVSVSIDGSEFLREVRVALRPDIKVQE